MEELKDGFSTTPLWKEHFRNPIETWESVATPNKDGYRSPIWGPQQDNLHLQKPVVKYTQGAEKKIKMDTLAMLEPNYESEDKQGGE